MSQEADGRGSHEYSQIYPRVLTAGTAMLIGISFCLPSKEKNTEPMPMHKSIMPNTSSPIASRSLSRGIKGAQEAAPKPPMKNKALVECWRIFPAAYLSLAFDLANPLVYKMEQVAELTSIPGHPLQTFALENEVLERLLSQARTSAGTYTDTNLPKIHEIVIHYAKKGDLLYPLLKVKVTSIT